MRLASPAGRAALLVLVATLSAGCTVFHETPIGSAPSAPPTGAPSPTSVHDGRFVSTVDIDDGSLVIDPAGTGRAPVSIGAAATMFRAADVVDGPYQFSVVGLGYVTVSSDVGVPPTTAAPTPGAPPGTTTSEAATTTAPSGTASASTTVPASSASTVPLPGGVESAALPTYDDRLAWVGIAWDATCPAAGTATTASAARAGPIRYTAVIFDARTGHDVLAYTSRGAATCGGPVEPASVTSPDELVSVPWQAVGPRSTAVQVSLPSCGTYAGWTGLLSGAVEVEASVPFDPECGTPATTQTVDDVVPLGSPQAGVPHAPLGPVEGERTLPGG